MSEPKKKCRLYSVDYLKYGFIPSHGNRHLPMCLICEKVLSNEAMKPSRMLDHLSRQHPEKADKDVSYFQALRDKRTKQPKLGKPFSWTSKEVSDGMLASYRISMLIAKAGYAHTVGEDLLIPVVSEVLETVLHRPSADVVKKIPLSNNTVQRRIDEMANNVEDALCSSLRTTQFSLQIDESCLPGNEALLLAYVRFIKDEKLVQELLFAKELVTDTKGASIFALLKAYFAEKKIPLANIVSVATDGAPSMSGIYRGFIAFLKQEVPDVLAVHCVIHRQHLVAKKLSERLHCSLRFVITAVNKIKTKSLNDRIFRKMCEENDESYNRLLLHTEVRWLSKGDCLNRFYGLFGTVLNFFEEHDVSLCEDLKKSKNDIAYMADLYSKFNKMNLQLQGDDVNLISTKAVVCSFIKKLVTFKSNLARRELRQFPKLFEINEEAKIHDEDIEVYCDHLQLLHEELIERFEDVVGMEVPAWIIDPFSCPDDAQVYLQEELVELQCNEELKPRFKDGYQAFWLQKKIPSLYPRLWAIVSKLLIAFPSSYLVEKGFSVVTDLLSKKRNRLEIAERGDLRLRLTNMAPDLQELVSRRQPQGSH
uniref:DUF4371 domain-containing protein n=1 Tax=Trichuris muris TaxID=70415 RepID=A0A5S6QK69_TRIMR